MTEAEWLNCQDPDKLFLDRHASSPRPERKLRLFGCACCRQIWDRITDVRCRIAVEVSEMYADGLATTQEFDDAFDGVEEACDEIIPNFYPSTVEQASAHAAQMALRVPADVFYPVARVLTNESPEEGFAERLNQSLAFLAGLFRDIFGNPFRLVRVDPSWLSWQDGAVVKLAQTIYEQRRYQDLPILASKLEEAGCLEAELLEHCRSKNTHVKGCWVVDLLLGKPA